MAASVCKGWSIQTKERPIQQPFKCPILTKRAVNVSWHLGEIANEKMEENSFNFDMGQFIDDCSDHSSSLPQRRKTKWPIHYRCTLYVDTNDQPHKEKIKKKQLLTHYEQEKT